VGQVYYLPLCGCRTWGLGRLGGSSKFTQLISLPTRILPGLSLCVVLLFQPLAQLGPWWLEFRSGRAGTQDGRGSVISPCLWSLAWVTATGICCGALWQGGGGMFQYWYSASVWVLISFSKGSICLLPNYVTNLHPNPLRIFIPVLQRYKFLGLPEIHRLKPLFRSLVKVLIFSPSSSFPGWCFSHDFFTSVCN
jgi:hypothetical protein